jgi:hypothetical protein
MNDDFESLQKNATWKLVEFPEGKKPLKCNGFIRRKVYLELHLQDSKLD